MRKKFAIAERCQKILEDYGGEVADKAKTLLLEDPALRDLRDPLEFVARNWRNPLTPAMMSMSCEAVGGPAEETHEVSLSMALMSLSFYVWDDIIDEADSKLFKPTLFGKSGVGTSLIVGGIASAKAFSILNQVDLEKAKVRRVSKIIWDLWTKMAQTEIVSMESRRRKDLSSKKKLWKIKMEAADLEACLRIGAVIGNGSNEEVSQLGRYGFCLGVVLELCKDFQVSVNLTSELAKRIQSWALPYSLIWAMERSEKIQKKLHSLENSVIEPADIREIVEDALEIGVMNNILRNIRRFTKEGSKALEGMKRNRAIKMLQIFIEAQPKLLAEILPSK